MNSNNKSLNVWTIHFAPDVLCCILFNASQPTEEGYINIPNLQIRKPKPNKVWDFSHLEMCR